MIYILENNSDFINALGKWLNKRNIEYVVHTSQEDYKFIDAKYYLIDLQLENWYSFDIIKDIRSRTKSPIAMFTHHTEHNLLRKGIESWANYYFCKDDVNLYSIHLEILWKMKDYA